MLAAEQPDVDVMADRVDMWGLETIFGYKIIQNNLKTWKFLSSSMKNKRDVDSLNWSKSSRAAWRAFVEIFTPCTKRASMALLDRIYSYRMSREEHPVDAGKSATEDPVQYQNVV